MRILVISHAPNNFSGPIEFPTFCLTVARFLRSGFEVHYLGILKYPNKPPTGIFKNLKIYPVTMPKGIHFGSFANLSPATSFIKKALHKILRHSILWLFYVIVIVKGVKIIQRQKSDLLYAFSPYSALPVWLFAKCFRIKCVLRLFGVPPNTAFYKGFALLCREVALYMACKMTFDGYIVTDDGTRGDRVVQSLGVSKGKIRFWRNGYDRRLLQSRGIARDPNTILSVCRLDAVKGVQRIIEAMPSILAEHAQARLIVVGHGAEYKRLERRTQSLGVENHVKFLGKVPWEATFPLYQKAAIFVALADNTNLTNTVIEALASGCCVVVLNTGDLRGFIEDGYNAVLVKKDSIEDLAKIINELLDDDKRRERLGNNARAFMMQHFDTWEQRIDKEINFLREIISGDCSVAKIPKLYCTPETDQL